MNTQVSITQDVKTQTQVEELREMSKHIIEHLEDVKEGINEFRTEFENEFDIKDKVKAIIYHIVTIRLAEVTSSIELAEKYLEKIINGEGNPVVNATKATLHLMYAVLGSDDIYHILNYYNNIDKYGTKLIVIMNTIWVMYTRLQKFVGE